MWREGVEICVERDWWMIGLGLEETRRLKVEVVSPSESVAVTVTLVEPISPSPGDPLKPNAFASKSAQLGRPLTV